MLWAHLMISLAFIESTAEFQNFVHIHDIIEVALVHYWKPRLLNIVVLLLFEINFLSYGHFQALNVSPACLMCRLYARNFIKILLHLVFEGHLSQEVFCTWFTLEVLLDVFSLHQTEASILINEHIFTLHPLVLVWAPQIFNTGSREIKFSFDFLLRGHISTHVSVQGLIVELDFLRNKSIESRCTLLLQRLLILHLLLLLEIQHQVILHGLLNDIELKARLISILLSLIHLVGQGKVLCNNLSTLLFLLLYLPN